MAVFERWYKQDLSEKLKTHWDEGIAFSGDNDSLLVGVELFKDGEQYIDTGTISCNVIRDDRTTVSFFGIKSGNKVYAILPANCFYVPGPIGVYIKVTTGATITTVFAGVFIVQATSTDTSVIPSETVTDIDALIAAVEAAVATIPPDYSDVIKALPTVTGYAYPFPATTWASSSSIDKDTGAVVTPDPDWSASDYIEIDPLYGSLKIVASGQSNGIYNAYYDESKAYVGPLTWGKNTTTIITPPANAKYIRLSKLDGTTLTVSLVPRDLKTWSLMSRQAVSTDLDDYELPGLYMLYANISYTNAPTGVTGGRNLLVFRYPAETYTLQILTCDYADNIKVFMRTRVSGTWNAWNQVYSVKDIQEGIEQFEITGKTISESFTPVSHSAIGNNTGIGLCVMQYNIAHYNHDTATYIPNDKLFNLKKLLRKVNPDVILTQEDQKYIDGSTKEAKKYLYNPQYAYGSGEGDVVIHSKVQTSNNGVVLSSISRSIRYGVLTIDGKNILLVSSHAPWKYNDYAGDSAEAKAARATHYQDLFKWCEGQINLPAYGTQTLTQVPEHSYAIIGMDANCVYADDKTALQSAASTYGGYTLSNGGEMGWMYTCYDSYGLTSIDVIAVSNNVIINGFEVLNNWYPVLYSDHYPVIANLTLLEE